ncbi:cytochrome P450 family protein [Ceratobasidium sp. AG-Ba]|nr:cytochrome P450 family protein [Ceratobasidium sp. AG-Ba]
MLDLTTFATAGLVTAAIVPLLYNRWYGHKSSAPLPPSPWSYPLIGNLLSIPSKDEHLGFAEIGKQLGTNIFSLSTLGTVIIVLNDMEDAVNLLEKRSSIYSDRPRIPMLVEPSLLDCSRNPAFTPDRDWWKKSRRAMHQWLNKQAAVAFQPSQLHQARLLLQRLLSKWDRLESSEELELEIYQTMSGTILHSVYGRRVQGANDIFVLKAKKAAENIMKGSLSSNFLVNIFPTLNQFPGWLPGMNWKKTAKKWREEIYDAIDSPYRWTKAEMEKGSHESSIVESILEQFNRSGMKSSEADDFVKEVGAVLFSGGIDTVLF